MKRIVRRVDKRSIGEKIAIIEKYERMINEEPETDHAPEAGEKLEELQRMHRDIRREYLEVTREAVPGAVAVPINGGFEGPFIGEMVRADDLFRDGFVIVGSDESDDTDDCQPVEKDFTLKLTVIDQSNNWNAPTTQNVNGGVMGWSTSLDRSPTLSNMNGKGGISGMLELKWSGRVPEDGVYIFQPNCHIIVNVTCFADGYWFGEPGRDAIAKVKLREMVTIGDVFHHHFSWEVCRAESSRTSDEDAYSDNLILLPQVFGFEGRKDQEVMVRIRLEGYTWTRESADAEVVVNYFGAIANVPSDTDIEVNG